MSRKSLRGKAAWAARSAGYRQELCGRIGADAAEQMDRWAGQGRIPRRIRLYARLRGGRLGLADERGQR